MGNTVVEKMSEYWARQPKPLREALDTPPLPAKSVGPGKYSVAADLPGVGKRRLRFEARTSQGDLFRSEFDVRVPSG